MNNIKLTLQPFPLFEFNEIKLQSGPVELELILNNGVNTIESNKFNFGQLDGINITAYYSLTYIYNEEENKIELFGINDKENEDRQLKLNLQLENIGSSLLVVNSSKIEGAYYNHWLSELENNNNLKEKLNKIFNSNIDNIVDALISSNINMVLVTGQSLVITEDNFKDFKYLLPENEFISSSLSANIIKLQDFINSTVVGVVTVGVAPLPSSGFDFANVKKSSGDTIPDNEGSWIKLWESQTNLTRPVNCCSKDHFNGGSNPNWCNTPIIGGHIILGQTAIICQPGATVYIFPICNRHNNHHNDAKYMTHIYNDKGVQLNYR